MLCTSCGKREAVLKFRHYRPCNKCFLSILEARMKKEFRGLKSPVRLVRRATLSRFVMGKLIKNPAIRIGNHGKIVLGTTLDEDIASYFAGKKRIKAIRPFAGITGEELEAYAGLNRIKIRKEPLKGIEEEFISFFGSLEARRPGARFSVIRSIRKIDNLNKKK